MDAMASLSQLGGALIRYNTERSIRKANRSVELATAEAENQIRGAANQRNAAQASLSRTLQTLNNARFVRGREDAIARARAASAREQSAASAGRLEARLRASEEAGAAQAQAAFSGVSGGFLDVALATRALQNQRADEVAQRDSEVRLFQDALTQGQLQGSMFSGQDTTLVNTNLDLRESRAPVEPYTPDLTSTLLQALTSNNAITPLVNWGASFFRPKAATWGDMFSNNIDS